MLFLRSHSALECGLEPKENMIFFEQKTQEESLGLIKMEAESHPYFKCLFSQWKKHAKSLIFNSCKYYFTR